MLNNELITVCCNYNVAIVEAIKKTTTYLKQNIDEIVNFNTFTHLYEYYEYDAKENIDILLVDYRLSQQIDIGQLDINKIDKETKIIALIDDNLSCKEKIKLTTHLGFDDFLKYSSIYQDLIVKLNIWTKMQKHKQSFSYKCLHIDIDNICVTFYGKEIKLSNTEFMILKCLVVNAEKSQTRQEIMDYVWNNKGKKRSIDPRTVDVNINRLRNNLKNANPKKMDVIQTIRSMGYCLKIED